MKRKDIDKHLEEKETKHLGLKLTAMEDLITQQFEIIDKQSEIINKQNEDFTKQNEEFTKQSVKITKQSGEITKQRAETNKLNENFERQKKEMKTEKSKASQQIELLYSITNSTKIIWKIEDATNQSKQHLSIKYEVAGNGFAFRFQERKLIIVFPGTTIKPDRPFIAKCHIVLLSRHTINCDMVEVKQKDITRGCERVITSISQEDIEKYSEPKLPGAKKKDLTLEIFITMQ